MIGAARAILRKDLAIEFRTRSALFAAIAFTVLAIVIFYFAWDATAVSSADLAPGVLWVIFVFSGLLGLHRSFGVEQADRAVDALLAAPVPRADRAPEPVNEQDAAPISDGDTLGVGDNRRAPGARSEVPLADVH